jgi:hypothetical protein
LTGEENLFLRGDGTWANPTTGGDNWGSQVAQTAGFIGGDGTGPSPISLIQNGAADGQGLIYDSGAGEWTARAQLDSQALSLAGNTLSLTNGGSVDLSGYVNTDTQDLSFAGTTLSLTDGGSVDLSSLQDGTGTDDQDLTLTGNTLSIESGNSVDLSGYLDNTDTQDLSLAGNILSLTNGGSVDLSGIGGSGSEQTLSFTGTTLTISGTGGNSVNLSSLLDNTDSQTLSLSGDVVSLTNGGSVDLSDVNRQFITVDFTGSFLTFSLSEGNTTNVNLFTDDTMDGGGSSGNRLRVDTNEIATQYDLTQITATATADNGLTIAGNGDVELGGTLIKDTEIELDRNQLILSSDIPFGFSTDTLLSFRTPRNDAQITKHFIAMNFGANVAGFAEQDGNFTFFNTVATEGLGYADDYFDSTPVANLKDRQIPDIQTVERMITDQVGGGNGAFAENADTIRQSTNSSFDFVFGSQDFESNAIEENVIMFDKSKGAFFAGRRSDTTATDAFRGFHSINLGRDNIASGFTSSVTGGNLNKATGNDSHVSGGNNNIASGFFSTIGGGAFNENAGFYGVISGGRENENLGSYSAITGGRQNKIQGKGQYVTVFSGQYAEASLFGSLNNSSGRFQADSVGQAQFIMVTVMGESTGGSDYKLYIDNISEVLEMPDNTAWGGHAICTFVTVDPGTGNDTEVGDVNVDELTIRAENINGVITSTYSIVGGSGLLDDADGDLVTAGFYVNNNSTLDAIELIASPPSGFNSSYKSRASCNLQINQVKFND